MSAHFRLGHSHLTQCLAYHSYSTYICLTFWIIIYWILKDSARPSVTKKILSIRIQEDNTRDTQRKIWKVFNEQSFKSHEQSLLLLLLSHFSCVWLCDPIDGSPPGSPVPGILQARTLEWVAISFSSAWKWKLKVKLLSHVRLLASPWTAAHQAPPSMGFSRQEYWSGVPLPSPMGRV